MTANQPIPHSPSAPEERNETATALIKAGLELFGQKGFAATSTREIAAKAGANISAIAYHFDGKEGLHAACVDAVVTRLGAVVFLDEIPDDLTPKKALIILETLTRAVANFLLQEQTGGHMSAFIFREMSAGTGQSIDVLYSKLFESRHRMLCQLWGIASGLDPESAQTRLSVFATIGQIIYFRMGWPVVRRRMNWADVSDDEINAISDVLIENLHASIERTRAR